MSHSSAGGAQELWVNIAAAFHDHGFDTRLIALYPDRKDVRATPAHLPWTYVAEGRPKSLRARLGLLTRLRDMLAEFRPDFIFTALPATNVIVPVAAKLAGLHSRTYISHHAPVQTNNPLLDRVDGWVAGSGLVHGVISVSKAVGDSLEHKSSAYRSKVHVITNAVPLEIEALLAELAARYPHPVARSRTVVATGRLAPQKNYTVLIRAARHMPDVRIRIVGTGPEEASLKALAEEIGVADRIEFLGFRERKEALEILAAGDVFVQPSLFEGHSLALVEAMKLGLPLVVSDVPSQIEAIMETDGRLSGIAVSPNDDAALAAAITSLLDDPATYADYAARSRQSGDRVSFASVIQSYLALASSTRGRS